MDFFRSQDDARRKTTRLVILLLLAVVALIAITNLLLMLLLGSLQNGDSGGVSLARFDWSTFLLVGLGVTAVVVTGSLWKIGQLAGGGKVVAEALGGTLVRRDTSDPDLRRALNVVEEMAIASGTPVPPVYLLADEEGINAFAAGFSTGDAVIGLTRGTIRELSRDELQGVIAHEFSHILNGDMRLNLRLIGILHGILLIGLIGSRVLRSTSHRSSKNAGGGAALGLGLMVIGYGGTFFGNLIKASVSRQREYLADASAVQFTRNPLGISGALKRIGGSTARLHASQAEAMSHLYFADGLRHRFSSLFATHPPLTERIRRIEPGWDGKYIEPVTIQAEPEPPSPQKPASRAGLGAIAGVLVADRVLESIGQPGPEQVQYSQELLAAIPAPLRTVIESADGARALVYSLLIDAPGPVRQQQLQQITAFCEPGERHLVERLLPLLADLDVRFRLPLVDLALPALRQLSPGQYRHFRGHLAALAQADGELSLFEWTLQQIVLVQLDQAFGLKRPGRIARFGSLEPVREPLRLLLGALTHACASDPVAAAAAFTAARDAVGIKDLRLPSIADVPVDKLGPALELLASVKPLLKPSILGACLAIVTADEDYSHGDVELMRAISLALACPMPPVPGR